MHSKIKQEISNVFEDKDLAILNDTDYHLVDNKKVTLLKVLKNNINNIAFLKDEQRLSAKKLDALSCFYFLFSIIPLTIILLILKIKSK